MYEVDYLAMIDLDEMILPVKHDSWSEMVQSLKPTPATSLFKFHNAFFIETKQATIPNCSNQTVPKYFSRTKHHFCWPGYHYKIKLMKRSKFVYTHSIHYVCNRVNTYCEDMNVPMGLAKLGHYRVSIPDDCAGKTVTTVDNTALKLQINVMSKICSQEGTKVIL